MTNNQYSEMIKSLRETIANFPKYAFPDMSELTKSIRELDFPAVYFPEMREFSEAAKAISTSLSRQMTDLNFSLSSLRELVPALSTTLSQEWLDAFQPLSHLTPALSEALRESIVESLRSSEEYMDSSQKATIDEIAPEILAPCADNPKPRFKLSIANLLTVLSLLMNIAALIIQQLPDEQLDQIITQNDVSLEQRQALIAQNTEEIAILKQINDTNQQILEYLQQLDDLPVDPPELTYGVDDESDRVVQVIDAGAGSDEILVDSQAPDNYSDTQNDDTDT